MTTRDQFHMILPSNSSMRYFPENTTTSFTTELPQQVDLHGQWEMALSEIQFPYSFFHIRPGEGWVVFLGIMHQPTKKEVTIGNINITPGVYSSLSELLRALNEGSERLRTEIVWRSEPRHGGKISLGLSCTKETCNLTHYVKISDKLRRILGFDVHKERADLVIPDTGPLPKPRDSKIFYQVSRAGIVVNEAIPAPANVHRVVHFPNTDPVPNPHEGDSKLFYQISRAGIVSDEPASLARAVPDKFFVYCDICEPYVTGDVLSPLLRVVPVQYVDGKYTYGSCGVTRFSPLNYVPLRLTRFRTIEIDIRNQMGERIPFEFGTLTVTLQFRRRD